MNTLSSHAFNAPRRGVALVIVLSMLVLLSAIMVAFMGTVSSERAAQRAAYSGFEAQQAAESAVNLVISQIRAATSNDDGTTGWASQPGAIRNFGTGANTVFKLYSSDNMQESETNYKPDSFEESGINPSDPKKAPAGFVDINQPVLTPGSRPGTVEPHYPIVDPRAGLNRENKFAGPGSGKVEGFWTPQDNFHFSGKKDSNDVRVMETPMRVRWLYQLKDGTMVAASRGDGRIPGAEKDNPPVARVAFWTDDDTSKLNINTASENTYWDTPMASAYDESGKVLNDKRVVFTDYKKPTAGLSASQPTQGEYQRYPGHPATTNLSPALRWLYPRAQSQEANDWRFKEALYRLLPRIRGGGGSSMGGTIANDDKDLGTKDYRFQKRDRLFASLDEFWFRPDRSPISDKGFFGVFREDSAATVPDPTAVDLNMTPQALEQLRFFLTANSRSPDLNAFGMPRVSIWPINESDNPNPNLSKRSGYDDLMAFCSSVSKRSYYFTRYDPWSPSHDVTVSGTRPVDPLPEQRFRNKKLLFNMEGSGSGYLQRLGNRAMPGVTGTLAGKYNSKDPTGNDPAGTYTEYERILLSIFDYIRSTNLVDTGRKGTTAGSGFPLAYTPGYSKANPPDYRNTARSQLGSGQVIPSVIYDPSGKPLIKGFGRFVNISEVGLLFYRDDAATLPADINDAPTGVSGTDYIAIRCVLLSEMWTVSPGYSALSQGYAYKVSENLRVSDPNDLSGNPVPIELARSDWNFVNVNSYRVQDGRFFMPTQAFNNQFCYDDSGSTKQKVKELRKPNTSNNAAAYQNYPFYSRRFYARKPATGNWTNREFKFEGGDVEFKFYPLDVPPGQDPGQSSNPSLSPYPAREDKLLQTVTVTFPPATLQIPNTPQAEVFKSRLSSLLLPDGDGFGLVKTTDVIRTVEANGPVARGDLRMVAGLAYLPKGNAYYDVSGADGDYANKTTLQVHNFRNGWGRPFPGAKYGTLSAAAPPTGGLATRRGDKIAKVPFRNGMAVSMDNPGAQVVGDFDRGMSKHLDGPFINKPDEGNTRFKTPASAGGDTMPYYRGDDGYEEVGATYFSPSRLVPSAVMFGSLPTGIFSGRPWETLLFCPPISNNHRGQGSSGAPADHYLLDLFHMPVVEPYAISEPLSTAGKINLNSRLAPFGYVKSGGRSYIQRHTGLYGVIKGMKQFMIDAALPTPDAGHPEGPFNDVSRRFRFNIDVEATLKDIVDPYLDSKKYFKYASEVCDLDLLITDNGPTVATNPGKRKTLWTKFHMTGDNARERPYSHIYPRLTTKSNTYTIHVWAQSIAKNAAAKKDDWAIFDESTDRILGEYRGSTTIERFIDADDEALSDYDAAENSNARGLDPYYRFRIINQKRFTPQ